MAYRSSKEHEASGRRGTVGTTVKNDLEDNECSIYSSERTKKAHVPRLSDRSVAFPDVPILHHAKHDVRPE